LRIEKASRNLSRFPKWGRQLVFIIAEERLSFLDPGYPLSDL
jgi:hypothetical protein